MKLAAKGANRMNGLHRGARGMVRLLAATLTLTLILATAATTTTAGAAPAAGALAIPINLLCTTCNDFQRCVRAAGAAPAEPVVYRIEEKSFWAQVATIGDYLMQLFRPKTRDERDASMYRSVGGQRRIERGLRVRIDSVAQRITYPDASIDQRTGDWFGADGARLGHCTALTRREGFALLREFLGRPAPGATP
jgi:hypothetical protein